MSKKKKAPAKESAPAPAVASSFWPSPGSLAGLTALGALAAGWAVFLWGELLASRMSGSPVCALGEPAACGALWDSAFASSIHRVTGLPLAAWGVVWGAVAFVLPLAALLRTAEGRPRPALVSSVRLTAAAGLVSVFVFVAVSAAAGTLCLGCVVTYVVVAGYAGIALFGWPGAGLPEVRPGAIYAGTALLLSYIVLLYPGTHTPSTVGEAGRDAVAAAAESFSSGPGTGDAALDQRLEELVSVLAPPQKQTLADSLFLFRRNPALTAPAPRHLAGPGNAPVRITEWTDVLCGHCADLHRTLQMLHDHVPEGSFAVDSRHFPLDGACNPHVQRQTARVRCVAAQAQICLEGHEKQKDFVSALFEGQGSLTEDKVYELAAPYVPRTELEACVASPETARKLADDIEAALPYEADGTPIVVVNGRRGTSFAPFLLATVLLGGGDAHPAFGDLPAPNTDAHLH